MQLLGYRRLGVSSPQPSPRTILSFCSNSSRGEGADRSKPIELLTRLENKHFLEAPLGLGPMANLNTPQYPQSLTSP
jgi:hypothetical protein